MASKPTFREPCPRHQGKGRDEDKHSSRNVGVFAIYQLTRFARPRKLFLNLVALKTSDYSLLHLPSALFLY